MQTIQSNKKHTGNALVFALLVVAVTSVIAYALIETSTFAVRRTTQLNNMDDCQQAAHAAELYAGQLLFQSEKQEPKLTDPSEEWAQPFEMNLRPMLTLKAQLTDMQGQFNLNSLGGEGQGGSAGIYSPSLIFTRLMVLLQIQEPQGLQQAVSHWVGEASSQEDQIYLERTPAYRVPHFPMASISELNLVQGFTRERVTVLTPYINALPPDQNKINVNTAPALVLAALLDAPVELLEAVVSERETLAFPSNEEFVNRAKARGVPIPDTGALQQMITVNSNHFLLKTEVTCQKNNLISYSFINRLQSGQIKVYRRTQAL